MTIKSIASTSFCRGAWPTSCTRQPVLRHPLPDSPSPDHHHASHARAWTNGPREPLTEQTRQCFANIEGALKAVQSSLADVVRLRIALPKLEQKAAVIAVVAEKFAGVDPARHSDCDTPLQPPNTSSKSK
ncbi:Rid family hydrolase [Paraburkholderia fungorum]|uniref:Rid family hydrolase n=1 Tax=Paraburkholderia fungorum TaxID=134537 RepID=UPI0038BC89C3